MNSRSGPTLRNAGRGRVHPLARLRAPHALAHDDDQHTPAPILISPSLLTA